MQHIAIMKKEWKLVDKILDGSKTIESRWYVHRRDPWMKVSKGDVVYFKEGLVKAKAVVDDVMFFSDLDSDEIKKILLKYHKEIGVSMDYYGKVKDKKYCILVFLKSVERVEEFDIDKKGFGNMCAWLCVEDVERLKIVSYCSSY